MNSLRNCALKIVLFFSQASYVTFMKQIEVDFPISLMTRLPCWMTRVSTANFPLCGIFDTVVKAYIFNVSHNLLSLSPTKTPHPSACCCGALLLGGNDRQSHALIFVKHEIRITDQTQPYSIISNLVQSQQMECIYCLHNAILFYQLSTDLGSGILLPFGQWAEYVTRVKVILKIFIDTGGGRNFIRSWKTGIAKIFSWLYIYFFDVSVEINFFLEDFWY